MRNPYFFEIRRQKEALREISHILRLYSNQAEIPDLNLPQFWDEIYIDENSFRIPQGMTRERIRAAVGFVPEGKQKVFDIGSGMGYLEQFISKDRDKELYGNDFSSVAVDYLNKKFNGKFVKESIYEMKYPKSFFDVILILEVLEHIPPSRIIKVLKNINSMLKTGGILIVSVPMNEGLEAMANNPSGHVRMYTENLIIKELEITGFRTIEYKTLFAFDKFYSFRMLIAKLTKKKYPNNIVLKAIKV
jgi:2-polyprenyl-3-methyl-5-hydroxy-6-metoxy-1,4-benzoquinol methylase